MEMADKHPPPWRWVDGALYDANDQHVLSAVLPRMNDDPYIEPSSPRVLALTEAAPEFEAFIRDDIVESDGSEPGTINEIIDFLCERPGPNGGRGVSQRDVERVLAGLRRFRDKAEALLRSVNERSKGGG